MGQSIIQTRNNSDPSLDLYGTPHIILQDSDS